MLARIYYALTSRKCRRAAMQMNPWMLLLIILLMFPTAYLIWQLWPKAWASTMDIKRQQDPMVVFQVGKLRRALATSSVPEPAESVQPLHATRVPRQQPHPSPEAAESSTKPLHPQLPPEASEAPESSTKQPSAGLKVNRVKPETVPASAAAKSALSSTLHPDYKTLIKEYPFQPVRNQRGEFVNIILVRSPFRSQKQKGMYERYKDSLLFIGISSFEDFPLPPPNPFSSKFPANTYVGLFPGFLHMEREPEKVFPPHVKLLLLSQSDFALPAKGPDMPKKYDFTFSGSDQDVHHDCVGWSSFAKNWTFAKQALEEMCSQDITGVLVATKDKQGRKACSIPANCYGKMVQTTFLSQEEFFKYVRQSRFLFVPQVHDASPRVTTQASILDWIQAEKDQFHPISLSVGHHLHGARRPLKAAWAPGPDCCNARNKTYLQKKKNSMLGPAESDYAMRHMPSGRSKSKSQEGARIRSKSRSKSERRKDKDQGDKGSPDKAREKDQGSPDKDPGKDREKDQGGRVKDREKDRKKIRGWNGMPVHKVLQ
eukprot:Skav216141  [mRNA]  locus=scaffold1946:408849:415570:- [translate_table: standard]